jgi:hypothetical protein
MRRHRSPRPGGGNTILHPAGLTKEEKKTGLEDIEINEIKLT